MSYQLALYLEIASVFIGVITCLWIVKSKVNKKVEPPVLDEVVETSVPTVFEYDLDNFKVKFEKVNETWSSTLVVGNNESSLDVYESDLSKALSKTLKILQVQQKQSCFKIPELVEVNTITT